MFSRPRRAFRLFLWVLRLTARRFLRYGQRHDLPWQQMLLCAARASADRASADRDSSGRAGWVRPQPDWRRLPFASAAFDVVVAAYVLQYVAEPASVLHECAQVLRPGGCLV
jgi:SAM-dependent methyltransferase